MTPLRLTPVVAVVSLFLALVITVLSPFPAAAQGAYDTYLRANRIEEGIANYNAVVRLMLGVSLDDQGNPRLR